MNPKPSKTFEPQAEGLTSRELDVLELLAQNLSDREIASRLTMALSSVKWYARQIYAKLGVDNRRQAVLKARGLRLLESVNRTSNLARNLPRQLTRFIGREKEIVQLVELIGKYPLVTLTGPGGVGKTRLALAVAEEMLEDFKDGVWLVELAAVTDLNHVLSTLCRTMGIHEEPGVELFDSLTFFLRERQALLILDNCEHLLDECARLAAGLLQTAPGLKLLATSREALGIDGERVFQVASLQFPPPDVPEEAQPIEALLGYESVQLFLDRAQAVLPEFKIGAENIRLVVKICQHLDGIPLAVELAAARVRMMTAAQIAARLDNVFRVLTGGSRNGVPRQQTLKATIDWSYALLSGQERLMLQRLAAFAGSWTLEAAEAVCAGDGIEPDEVLDLLGGLVDKSLATLSQRDSGEGRYRMLETVRQYARDRLLESGDLKRVRDRHLDYYLSIGKQAGAELRSAKQLDWMAKLESELENLRLALEWSLAGRLQDGLRLASALMWFWHFHNRDLEGTQWLTKLLEAEAAARGSQPLAAGTQKMDDLLTWTQAVNALVFLYFYTQYQSLMGSMNIWSEKCIALCRAIGEPATRELAVALRNKGAYLPLPEEEAIVCLQESLDICQKKGYRFEEAECLINWGFRISDGFQKKIDYLETSLEICRELGDPDAIASRLRFIAQFAFYLGDTERVRVILPEAIELERKVGNLVAVSEDLVKLYYMFPEPANALLAQEALAYVRDHRFFNQNFVICMLIKTEWSLGNYNLAESLAEEALAANTLPDWGYDKFYPRLWLVRIALSQGNPHLAGEILNVLIAVVRNENDYDFSLWIEILEAIGLVKIAKGQMAHAVRLFAASDKSYQLLAFGALPRGRSEREAALTTLRAALGEKAFEREWQAGQAMSMWQAFEWVRSEINLISDAGPVP